VSAVTVLEVEGLHKSFGRTEVLKGIDVELRSHEVVCLIGASGSGKSTLLRCVNLLEPIDAGRIEFLGEEITAPKVDANQVRRGIGIVFQAFNLFPHMSVLRNVTLGPKKVLGLSTEQAETERSTFSAASGSWTRKTSTRIACPGASSSGRRSCARSP
jgi:ABC-type polar amino acid transport system ATPase subunit